MFKFFDDFQSGLRSFRSLLNINIDWMIGSLTPNYYKWREGGGEDD